MQRGTARRSGMATLGAVALAALYLPAAIAAELPQYQLLEIGPPEVIPGFPPEYFTQTIPIEVNSDGTVTGRLTPSPFSVGSFLFAAKVTVFISAGAFPVDINDAGQILLQFGADGASAWIRESNGASTWIPNNGATNLFASDINDLGSVTGMRESFPSIGSPSQNAFVFSGSTTVDLDPLPSGLPFGPSCGGIGINNAQRVAGICFDDSGQLRAFLSVGTSVSDLGTLGGAWARSVAINERSQVTGQSAAADGSVRGFLYSDGRMSDLGNLGGFVMPKALNNLAAVVGIAGNPQGQVRAFLSQAGVMIDLGTLNSANSTAADINDAGEVVGQAQLATGHYRAFVYRSGAMYNLGALGRLNSEAVSINALGQVAGVVYDVDREYDGRGFLATPITLLLDRLHAASVGLGPGKSLANSVSTATAQYNANDLGGTCGALDDFTGKVSRFTGVRKNQVPPEQSAKLISDAVEIKTAVGCL